MTRRMQQTPWRTPALTSLIAVGGLVGCSDSTGNPASADIDPSAAADSSMQTPGTSMAAGEGEGASEAIALSTDDVAYLTQVGLMRGHLWVGHQLYLSGLADLSATHMKHPEAELYSTLVDAFEMRGVAGFANALSVLSERVSAKRPNVEVQQAYDALQQQIAESESGADTGSARVIGGVIVGLLRTAGEEYAIGVVNGAINNVHEYQDALGFTQIARQWASSPVFAADADGIAAAAFIQSTLDDLLELWPELAPTAAVPFEAARIYGAAAQIELRVLGLN